MGKGILIVLLVLGVAGAALLRWLGSRPAAPKNYQQMVETGGPVEEKYLASGPYEVSFREEAVLQVFQKYLLYYPTELETGGDLYPVIVLCNGSGTPLSKYDAVARHLASWGFLVIGTEETYAWNGFGAEMCLRHLERLNSTASAEEAENPFYQRIDFDRVGIAGHSQGGVGVFNAITSQPHAGTYRAAAALSPTNRELAHNLEWDYDASQISTPILLLSGAGGGDDWVVTGEQLQEIYGEISAPRYMARRRETGHGEMLYSANGYVTAWFLWHLQGDAEAGGAFIGETPELMANALYQDQANNINES